MPLFVLAETSAGYGLFKAKDKKLLERDDVSSRLGTAEKINEELKLKEFKKYESAAQALEELDGLLDGKVPKLLEDLLGKLKDEKRASLAVADKSLGTAIQKLPGLNITAINAAPGSIAGDVYRGIREHMAELIPGIQPEGFKTMSLGLSHSLSRHKLKFSADKVDIMIIQAISLLDDMDKELNTYAMRVKEWYGWHFPELGKILNDNLAYARVILAVGMRDNIANTDLADILPEEIEAAVKAAADVSMGTEIAEEDLENIQLLAEQVISYSEYRAQLSSYLESRMKAIAPNVTELVNYLVGARLISHTGSLMNLAKSAGSTIQILGAEKALFRALKTKHATPKYGLIYHSSLVGQATGKNKGKIARQLASKLALGARTDALSEFGEEVDEEERAMLGTAARCKLENNLRRLEGKPLLPRGAAVGPNESAAPAPSKWDVKEARKYNINADGLAGDEPAALKPALIVEEEIKEEVNEEVKEKKSKKEKKRKQPSTEEDEDVEMENGDAPNGTAGNAPSSPTLSVVSEDTESEPEALQGQWQSSITGATIKAKVARNKEHHQRNLELASERAAKRAARKAQEQRQLDRAERRRLRENQIKRRANRAATNTETKAAPATLSEADYERMAAAAGLSVKKFKRKFERGDVEMGEDGTPLVHSKKELKKLRKAEVKAAAAAAEATSSKRKRDDDGEKPKKRKKKTEA